MKNLTKFLTVFLLVLLGASNLWAANRTFKSGEVIFFKDKYLKKDNMNSCWKNSSGNIYAYFYGDGVAWSGSGAIVSGNWNEDGSIYSFTVPGTNKKFTTVIFTRGTAATFDSGFWNKTGDQTTTDDFVAGPDVIKEELDYNKIRANILSAMTKIPMDRGRVLGLPVRQSLATEHRSCISI